MITITINDEKTDGSKSIWTLKLESEEQISGPGMVAMLVRQCALEGVKVIMEPIKLK